MRKSSRFCPAAISLFPTLLVDSGRSSELSPSKRPLDTCSLTARRIKGGRFALLVMFSKRRMCMLTPQSRLRLNEQEVAAKVIDGEAIIINLANGIYYSMDKVGALIWETLAEGHSLAEVTVAVLARYDIPQEQAEADVQKLAAELVQGNLLVG